MAYKVFAWAWPVHAVLVNEWRDQISPNLGLVHSRGTYHVARKGDIARVESESDARAVAERKDIFSLAVLGDERNVDGPSGSYETPERYLERMRRQYSILISAGVRTSHKGLAMVDGKFDYEYAKKLTIGDYRGANAHPVDFKNLVSGIERFELDKWFVTLIPWRWWWTFTFGFLMQYFYRPSVKQQLKLLMEDEQVLGVGVWCLREHRMGSRYNNQRQRWHGLIDWNNNLTWQGRMIQDLLE